jgi:hypothetical protein
VSAPVKLAGFAAGLVVAFGVAAAAGSAHGPDRKDDARAPEHGGMEGHEADPIRGLATREEGLTLALGETSLDRGAGTELSFAIDGKHGPITDFEVTHEKRMHLIVVRRDGTGFQHLHPELGDDGAWRTPIVIEDAGAYRVYADFSRNGEAHTLAADLTVDGEADYAPFPPPTTTTATDGYRVELNADGPALDFTITKDGKTITTEPYLGAGGHLVALREGDLAFLHVHPEAGDAPRFEADLDPDSRYHLYLQFKHGGAVHTAQFTR